MLTVREIAREFHLKAVGKDEIVISSFGSLYQQKRDYIFWVKDERSLARITCGCVVVSSALNLAPLSDEITYLITDGSPRLVFAKILQKYFARNPVEELVDYSDMHRSNPRILIGPNTFIGSNVQIGDGTVIHPNVVIYSNTRIGKNCIIRTHVSLGTEGLGLEFDSVAGEFVKFPQLGGVILEDNVEIGPTATVRRSALDDTIIGRGTKIGSLVNIGHNCVIGKNCILTCQIVTSGSSSIGDNVFMGVNSTVKNRINIGNNVTVGQGAVVTKDIPDNAVYIGNPAENINDYKLWIKLKKHLFKVFFKEVNGS